MHNLQFFCILVFTSIGRFVYCSDKIVGGVEASAGEFPWMVTIKTDKEFCGGALISPSLVLTAGHCGTAHVSRYVVTAGVHSLKTPSGYEVSHAVRNISVHKYFSMMNGQNDIAVLRLQSPFEFNNRVTAIDLVGDDYVADGYVVVAGWGVESETSQTQPNALLKVRIPIASYAECKKYYDSSANQTPIHISDAVVCAGGDGKSACFGDSGGPLMCPSSDTASGWVCCGVVSAGAHCGGLGVYSKVSYYRNWIRQVAGI